MLTVLLFVSSRVDAWGDASEAHALAIRYGSQSAEARVAWSELEDIRAWAAKPEPVPLRDCSRFDRIRASNSYAVWLRRTRNEMRRREASRSFEMDLCNLGSVPLTQLFATRRPAKPCLPTPKGPDPFALAREAAAATDVLEAAYLYDALEEVLSADNSVAWRPSLDDDDSSLESDASFSLELALELLETISWKAEQLGAFGNRRDFV